MTQSRQTTVLIPASTPRNPLAVLARQRKAGAHGRQAGAERRAGRDALRRELSALGDATRGRPPSP